MSSDQAYRLIADAKAATSVEAELSKLESLEKLMRGNYQLLYMTFSQIASLAESNSTPVHIWLCELFRKAFTNNNLPHQIAPGKLCFKVAKLFNKTVLNRQIFNSPLVLPRMLNVVSKYIESADVAVAIKGLSCASGIFASMLTLM